MNIIISSMLFWISDQYLFKWRCINLQLPSVDETGSVFYNNPTCLSNDVVPANDVGVSVMQLSKTGIVEQIMIEFHDMPDVNSLSNYVDVPSNSFLKPFPRIVSIWTYGLKSLNNIMQVWSYNDGEYLRTPSSSALGNYYFLK